MPERLNILAIRFSSMGDLVMVSAALRCMYRQIDGIHLHLVTHEEYEEVIPSQLVHDITLIHNRSYHIAKQILKKKHWDYIVDFQNTIRSRRFTLGLSGKVIRTPKYPIRYWLNLNLGLNTLPAVPIAIRHITALSFLGVQYDDEGLSIPTSAPTASKKNNKKSVVIATGGTHVTKRIPPNLIDYLINSERLYDIQLIGGSDVSYTPPNSEHLTNYIGNATISQSIQIIKECDILITGDTGMMHIGAALNRPMIIVWGSTDPIMGYTPLLHQSNPAEVYHMKNDEIRCRPCSKYGRSICPKKHMNCLNKLSTNELRMAIDKLL